MQTGPQDNTPKFIDQADQIHRAEVQKSRKIEFPGLTVTISEEQSSKNRIDLILLQGRIDSQNAYKINRQAHNNFLSWDKDILIGLADLEYINSVGIAILFSIFHRQKEVNKKAAIGGMHPFLKQVFELVHFPSEVLILDDLEAAKQALL